MDNSLPALEDRRFRLGVERTKKLQQGMPINSTPVVLLTNKIASVELKIKQLFATNRIHTLETRLSREIQHHSQAVIHEQECAHRIKYTQSEITTELEKT